MTTYTVKNGSSQHKAFKVDGGHQIVRAGKDGEVTTTSPLTEEQIDAYAADGVKVVEKKTAKAETGKEGYDPRKTEAGDKKTEG